MYKTSKRIAMLYFILVLLIMSLSGCSSNDDGAGEDALFLKTDQMIQEGKYEEALEAFTTFLVDHPKSDLVWRSKSDMLDKLDRTEEALVAIDKAIELDPDSTYLNIKAAFL